MATSQTNDDESNRVGIDRIGTGVSIPDAVHDRLYLEELRERKAVAKRNRNLARHGTIDADAVREWAEVMTEYAAEIERVEERLEVGREAAVEARRDALEGGDSL